MLQGWKTLGVAMLIAATGIAQQADWAHLVPPQYSGYVLLGIGTLMAGLRLVTTTPVGTKS